MSEMPTVKVDGTCVVCGHDHDRLPCSDCAGCGADISNGQIDPGCDVCLRFLRWSNGLPLEAEAAAATATPSTPDPAPVQEEEHDASSP